MWFLSLLSFVEERINPLSENRWSEFNYYHKGNRDSSIFGQPFIGEQEIPAEHKIEGAKIILGSHGLLPKKT